VAGAASPVMEVQSMLSSQTQCMYVYAISVMVPCFDNIAYNAMMMGSLPRFYDNEGMQPNSCQVVQPRCCIELVSYIER
jgi:hypothetical protein